MHFSATIVIIKSDRLFNNNQSGWNLRRNLISKSEYFESTKQKFSHLSEMIIVFISDLRNMTYGHYLQIPKSMLEWTIIKKLANNPKLMKKFRNTSHPLIRKYCHIIDDEEI